MMLQASLPSHSTLGSRKEASGRSCGFLVSEQKAEEVQRSWIPRRTSEIKDQSLGLKVEDGTMIESPQENECKPIRKFKTAHWGESEEPLKPSNDLLSVKQDRQISIEKDTRSSDEITFGPRQSSLELAPVPGKAVEADHNLDWKPLPSTRLESTLHQPRKSYLSRSISLTEKELKEAKSGGDEDAAQLSTIQSGCSRGALLFNRRRQKLKTLEQQNITRLIEAPGIQETRGIQTQHGVTPAKAEAVDLQVGSGHSATVSNMEETSPEAGYAGEVENMWRDELRGEEFPPIDKRAPSLSASDEDNQVPLSLYLKENMVVSPTNGLVNQTCHETEPTVKKEQNGVQNKQYCEVHLTLAKPVSVANRTAKPFGAQSSAKRNLSSDKSPVIDLPPPPTYAETLSSPPPVSRIRSPPAYSALYPTETNTVLQVARHGETMLTSKPKSGILEGLGARRGPKKSMFTFIEKPKMTPNPDLLSMVQTADERRKQKEQGEVPIEEEPFDLGAEASNFQNNKVTRAGDNAQPTDIAPEWSTCLKSPGARTKPPLVPIQTLTEAKGKGAELFARRQSRMERFVVESPSHHDSARSPSPTMSLPPSWKYVSSAQVSPMAFGRPVKGIQRSPKPPTASPLANTASESEKSQKELEISKRQPYQLQSSLFILSPTKDPMSSLPRAAPPPKPMVLESHRFTRQSSCPPSSMVPSPTMQSPVHFHSHRSPSATLNPSPANDMPTSFGRRTPTSQVPPASPVPFSNAGVASPRTKAVVQAPRPSFSARSAGLETQRIKEVTPAFLTQRALQHRGSLDGWGSSSLPYFPGYPEGSGMTSPPPPARPMSPTWSDRSSSPFRVESEPRVGKQMKALIARNIINAARRKSGSPLTSPQSPFPSGGPWSPRMGNGTSLPETPSARRSPTGSDISLESEDSGAKSPGFRSYSLSPRGWYGSMSLKRGSLPTNPSYT
ncbi:hypothetical protein FKM82_011854 [Ascaphus truei]